MQNSSHIVVQIDPVIFTLGPLQVRWYGLMYVIGFIISGYLLKVLVRRGFFKVTLQQAESLITYMMIGMFLGARLVYIFVYNWDYYQHHLSELFSVWKGGLSYHGALIGLLAAGYIFAKKHKISWAQVMDVVALAGAQGVFFGRMGNFINGELYGRISDVPWAMIFPEGGPYPRHPSQIYEGLMEGLVLTVIFWVILKRVKVYGIIASIYLVGYASFRFLIEFFREPDSQLGYYFGNTLTMGQILCIIMMLIGFAAIYGSKKLNDPV